MQLIGTCLFGETGLGAFKYLSFIARRLAVTLGKTEAKPGMWLRTQINSFSIQLRSWLLQTEMMNSVCKKNKHTRSIKICRCTRLKCVWMIFLWKCKNLFTYSGAPNWQAPSIWFSNNKYINMVLRCQNLTTQLFLLEDYFEVKNGIEVPFISMNLFGRSKWWHFYL